MYERGYYDNTVSRVYYAMYFVVQSLFLTKNIQVKSHIGLISKFGELFIRTEIFSRELGRNFKKAFEKRLIGDYNSLELITKEDAEEILESGKVFIRTIKDYLHL